MKVQDLQTEIASHGYGPALVTHWEEVQRDHPELLPQNYTDWVRILFALSDMGSEHAQFKAYVKARVLELAPPPTTTTH